MDKNIKYQIWVNPLAISKMKPIISDILVWSQNKKIT